MKKYFKLLMLLLIAILPSSLKIIIYNRFCNAEIDASARIGLSLIDVKKIKIGAHAVIGHFNVIKGLELLELGEYAVIRKQNTISALNLDQDKHFKGEEDRYPALILGAHSAIVSKHFLDCNNTIKIGHHVTVAGIGTAFFTHAINVEKNCQESAPITIGDYAMIGALCCVLKGSNVADCCIVAANSTIRGHLDKPHSLYSGVPAKFIKEIDPQAEYFHREIGYVS